MLLYFLLAICDYPRHWPVMGQGRVELYYVTVFLTKLLKKPRINTEKPIKKVIASPQNSLMVKFIRHNTGPVLTSEWPIGNNISPFSFNQGGLLYLQKRFGRYLSNFTVLFF